MWGECKETPDKICESDVTKPNQSKFIWILFNKYL